MWRYILCPRVAFRPGECRPSPIGTVTLPRRQERAKKVDFHFSFARYSARAPQNNRLAGVPRQKKYDFPCIGFFALRSTMAATALGLFLAGTAAGYFAHHASRSLWPKSEPLSDDEDEDLQDEDWDEHAHPTEECKMVGLLCGIAHGPGVGRPHGPKDGQGQNCSPVRVRTTTDPATRRSLPTNWPSASRLTMYRPGRSLGTSSPC